jgi:hypothetical protein
VAAAQLGLRYGHVAIDRPAQLDRFLTLYETWLARLGKTHDAATFRQWATNEYRGGPYRAELALIDSRPLTTPRQIPLSLRVKARNVGCEPWQFSPTPRAGIHLCVAIWNDRDEMVTQIRAGFLHKIVQPGESIELTAVLPATEHAGRYRLMIDLFDEQQCLFFQVGSETLEEELHVRE